MSSNNFSMGAYIRVASLAIAAYDFLLTSTAALRIYKTQSRSRKLNWSTVLFFLLQVTSIGALTVSNIGFFSSKFTPRSCRRFYMLAPLFKTFQAAVSQAVLALRAWNLSRRQYSWGYAIGVLYIASITIEAVTTLFGRTPTGAPGFTNCLPGSRQSPFLTSFTFYAASMCYDIGITAISVYFLVKFKHATQSHIMTSLMKMMILDGVGYFVALTAVNVANLILYSSNTSAESQTSAASLGYCFVWVFTQKLLIHLHQAHEKYGSSVNTAEMYTATRRLESARDVADALRSQFEPRGGRDRHHQNDFDTAFTTPTRIAGSLSISGCDENIHGDIDRPGHAVEVRVEKTYKVSRNPMAYRMESYTTKDRGGAARTTTTANGAYASVLPRNSWSISRKGEGV